MALRWTMKGRYSGTGWPRSRDLRMPNFSSASCMKWRRCSAGFPGGGEVVSEGRGAGVRARTESPRKMYKEGQAVPQDHQKAVKWVEKAAEQGSADANSHSASSMEMAMVFRRIFPEAVQWWRKAAEQGDVDAMRNLGIFYFKGKGVPQDYVQFYLLVSLAASRIRGKYNHASKHKRPICKIVASRKTRGSAAHDKGSGRNRTREIDA